ncbi:hypothetical protein Tco_0715040 [Tanacetum coccineum]
MIITRVFDMLHLRRYMEGDVGHLLKATRDRQKSYTDNRRTLLEFEVGDQVLLKVSPWKGVVRFGKKGKLAPRYAGPFEIIERIGYVAYRLILPQELSSMHDRFHVLNLKKCLVYANLHVPLEEIKVDNTLCFVEKTVEIMDRKVKRLKCSKIPIIKLFSIVTSMCCNDVYLVTPRVSALVGCDKWQPPRSDTCVIFDHNDDQCPKKVKVVVPNQVSDDGFAEASTSQPKENKEPSALKPKNTGKDVSDLQEINVVSLQNSFDALIEKDKNFEVNNEPWKATNDIGSKMDDSDSEKVKNVFVEDNEKHMDNLVDDTRKNVEAPPKKTGIWSSRKAGSPKRNVVFSHKTKVHYFDMDDMIFDDIGQATEEVEHENAYSKNS